MKTTEERIKERMSQIEDEINELYTKIRGTLSLKEQMSYQMSISINRLIIHELKVVLD